MYVITYPCPNLSLHDQNASYVHKILLMIQHRVSLYSASTHIMAGNKIHLGRGILFIFQSRTIVLMLPLSLLCHIQCRIGITMTSQWVFWCLKSTVSLTLCLTVRLDWHQRKYQSPRHRPFVRGMHRWPMDSPHKGQITQKPFPFDDIMMD